MTTPIRIGAVSYLNAKPLYLWSLRFCTGCRDCRWMCRAGWPRNWRPVSWMSP